MLDEHFRMPFETEMLGVTVHVEKLDLLDDDSIVAGCRRGPLKRSELCPRPLTRFQTRLRRHL